MNPPTLTDILRAKQTIARYLPRTPLVHYPAIDRVCDARILVKHENQQLTGAFKVRGGINLVSQLSADERARGVITASTGNQGQSVAYAASLFGVRATVVAPEKSNPLKVTAMRDLGAEVLFHGADFDAAREHCEALAHRDMLRYIHSANEPALIAGVATTALEILEDAPEVTTIIVPVGGGSGAAGACLVVKTLNPITRVNGDKFYPESLMSINFNLWFIKDGLTKEQAERRYHEDIGLGIPRSGDHTDAGRRSSEGCIHAPEVHQVPGYCAGAGPCIDLTVRFLRETLEAIPQLEPHLLGTNSQSQRG